MNDLHEAYAVLQLQSGISLDLINKQYKRLAMQWHPDKFRTIESKAAAERELKKINHARDILRSHFQGGVHRPGGGCDCERTIQANAEISGQTQAYTSAFRTNDASEGKRETEIDEADQNGTDKTKQTPPESNSYPSVDKLFHTEFREKLKEQNANIASRCRASKLCAAVLILLLLSAVIFDVALTVSKSVRNIARGRHLA